MADSYNPYETPAADLAIPSPTSAEQFTPAMVLALAGTKPWVRFLSILGFVFAGLMFLAGVITIVAGFFAGGELGGGFGALLGVFYFVLGGLYIIPLVQLHKFANAIGGAVQGGGAPAIEEALGCQRSFWRTVGIMTLVVLALYFVGIFVGVIVGLIGAMGSL